MPDLPKIQRTSFRKEIGPTVKAERVSRGLSRLADGSGLYHLPRRRVDGFRWRRSPPQAAEWRRARCAVVPRRGRVVKFREGSQ